MIWTFPGISDLEWHFQGTVDTGQCNVTFFIDLFYTQTPRMLAGSSGGHSSVNVNRGRKHGDITSHFIVRLCLHYFEVIIQLNSSPKLPNLRTTQISVPLNITYICDSLLIRLGLVVIQAFLHLSTKVRFNRSPLYFHMSRYFECTVI